jgi:rare lipoprotein A (peptidoglycan hydrolase)
MRMRQTIRLSLALLIVSATAMAKQADASQDQPAPSIKSKPAKADAAVGKPTGTEHPVHSKMVARPLPRHALHAQRQGARLPPPDQYIGPLQVIGRREIGAAAWYGGHHLGRRTASGERLDAVPATAAHRSLPLHSLVRVTNLSNGRSVVARITDRGPVSHSLLIDVSPRVADVLDMKRVGIVTVAIDPVAPAPDPPR